MEHTHIQIHIERIACYGSNNKLFIYIITFVIALVFIKNIITNYK